MKLVTSGEIEVGMFVVGYESVMFHRVVCPLTGFVEEQQLIDRTPWFKGVPYEVVGRAGPILSVKSNGFQGHPPIVFFDTRLVKFMEVDKQYNEDYLAYMSKQKV